MYSQNDSAYELSAESIKSLYSWSDFDFIPLWRATETFWFVFSMQLAATTAAYPFSDLEFKS